ncbi:MAG: nitroreductase [Leptothrix sp. (in: Bacteria)]|nr:nitroreductase [Leptothrix sp. (in: b-proteobacteria)]
MNSRPALPANDKAEAATPAARPGPAEEVFATVRALIESRQTVLPKRLVDPGPTPDELQALLGLAAAAPDHGQITPWRFIVVPAPQRHRLAEVFAQSLAERDPAATPEQLEQARGKAYRAPLLMLAVACLGPREPDVPALERMVSMGAALQNLLLGAHALGYGAGLTSGQAMASPQLRRLCALAEGEVPVCCVNVGSATRASHRLQPRPVAAQLLSELPPAPGDESP